jgi:ADP-ribose pyrophosphatase YjhB (NUDIX family)
MSTIDDLYQLADELRAIASLGLRYTEGGYDRERYEQVLKASARLVAALEHASAEDIYAQYSDSLAHLSPVTCVEAVVMRAGKVLLIQRRDDQHWALPGGLAEVGESLAEAAQRELWEEAGVRGQAVQLLGVFDSRLWPVRTRMQLCMAMFLFASDDLPALHAAAGESGSAFAEVLDVGFFAENSLPPLSLGHDLRVPMAFKILRGEIPAPFFDPSLPEF